LIYGTNDGGATILCSNRDLNEKMALAAQILNIASESVWDAEELRGHKMSASCDIEGHCGRDNRFYLVGK
jgi:hypothetical protein